MGNKQSKSSPQQLYTFVQDFKDSKLGECKIYKSRFHPSEFVTAFNINVSYEQVHLMQNSLKSFQHSFFSQNEISPFLKIIHWNVSYEDKSLSHQLIKTCRIPQITVWMQYLRHNLKSFLKWRNKQNFPLSIQEIKLAADRAIKAYQITKKNQAFGLSLKLQDISITIDGEIKLNPLLGNSINENSFFKNTFLQSKSENFSILRSRILEKRSMNAYNNLPNKIVNINSRKDVEFSSPQSYQDYEFLFQLKKFIHQLVSLCENKVQNPEDSFFSEAKEISQFIYFINNAKTLKEVINIVGKPSIDRFIVDFSKIRHLQSQAKFQKILSQLQQKSQRTDYSLYNSPVKKSGSRNLPNIVYTYSPPQYHRFS